jgi:hypothetical protein
LGGLAKLLFVLFPFSKLIFFHKKSNGDLIFLQTFGAYMFGDSGKLY